MRILTGFLLCLVLLCPPVATCGQATLRTYTPPAAPSFSDNFNRSDRALNGDNGWAWAVNGGGFQLVSNRLEIGSAVGDSSQVNAGASFVDGYVQADVFTGGVASASSIGLIFRYQDANNFYLMDFAAGGGQAIIITFYKRGGGTYTQIGSPYNGGLFSWDGVAPKTAKVMFTGTSVHAWFDGVDVATFSDSSISAAGLTGLRNGGAGTAQRYADNFSAVSN